jgi:hypothetical protein
MTRGRMLMCIARPNDTLDAAIIRIHCNKDVIVIGDVQVLRCKRIGSDGYTICRGYATTCEEIGFYTKRDLDHNETPTWYMRVHSSLFKHDKGGD